MTGGAAPVARSLHAEMTPFQMIVLRVLNLTLLRWSWTAELFRSVVVRRLITGRHALPVHLKRRIRIEADRLFNSYVKREDLVSEMTVVRNEFESGENSPQRILSQRIHAAAYEWHNYGKSTIGNRSDIERVPIENLQAFYTILYCC